MDLSIVSATGLLVGLPATLYGGACWQCPALFGRTTWITAVSPFHSTTWSHHDSWSWPKYPWDVYDGPNKHDPTVEAHWQLSADAGLKKLSSSS
jgi:hypothetical protein